MIFPLFVTNVSILFICMRIPILLMQYLHKNEKDTTRYLMLYALDYKDGQDKD